VRLSCIAAVAAERKLKPKMAGDAQQNKNNMKDKQRTGSAPEGSDFNNTDPNEFDSGSENAQLRYVDFGLRRLVRPSDLEFPPGGDGSSNPEDVVNAACDNIAVGGQDTKDGAWLVKRGVVEKDPVALTSGLWVLASLSANMERMLDVQFNGLQGMAIMMLGERAWPDPVIRSRASLQRERGVAKPGKLLARSLSAIIRMADRLERFDGQFRGNFVDTKTATTMKALRKFQLVRLTLPSELKDHVSAILDSPEVKALVPEAGPINGSPVPLFTRHPKSSAKD
jgi:hypothetical protein